MKVWGARCLPPLPTRGTALGRGNKVAPPFASKCATYQEASGNCHLQLLTLQVLPGRVVVPPYVGTAVGTSIDLLCLKFFSPPPATPRGM